MTSDVVSRTPSPRSDRDNLNEVIEADEVCDVTGVEPRRVGVCSSRNQYVHGSGSGPTASLDDCRGQMSVARSHGVVHRNGIERPLKQQQSTKSFRADILVLGDEHAEM